MRPTRLKIPDDTAAAVSRGHPWVFRDRPFRASVGEMVDLADDRDRIVAWGLYDDGPIAVRVLGRGPAPDDGLGKVIAERILRADRLRQRLAPPDTDAWRVVNGEGDGLPGLVLDRYGDLAVLRIYAAGWQPHQDAIAAAVGRLGWAKTLWRRLGVARVDGGDGGVALIGDPPPDRVVITEHGMKMLVRPHVGQKTGLFLDQREHRALVRRWASGRLVTNLFAYNGGFSLAAALGGAARVITVDIAPDAIADARENFSLNGLDPGEHGFEAADAFQWKPPGPQDLIIVDPPSLAHDRATEASARRAYRRLHQHVGGYVAVDGLLATSSCTARLGLEPWRALVAEALAPLGDWSWHHVSAEPPDHPVALAHAEGRYLKFALLRRRSTN
jgi:23S rRNA (cytosine1962-C5)-methyltransferase